MATNLQEGLMALTAVDTSGLPDGTDDKIAAILTELQGLKFDVVNGAAAVTNIAVTGITTQDTICAIIMFAAGVPSKVTDGSITSNGNIQLATTNSTGNKLVVVWFDKS